ncbi:twin-arginine translocase TatA/TatE family subunit [Methylocystis hirsuta]|uniref:Sec-independent protein translocase protein TatA n=1 Tax=Methylocystis hirsuta TaxID=369798 RepID=A0A3M9XPV1_9HYPH|nr:twin-arginine translocase TatA/TatE family subunit [Methylocystis hirsuta]RNJ50319.1 twin-arginine translocase TatA/TatE family subunit [Methylocystis hirsuta]
MGGLSIWHWIIVGAVVFILFGSKFKISDVMGDVAKGIKAFKKGMSEDDVAADDVKETPKTLRHQAAEQSGEEKSSETKKI